MIFPIHSRPILILEVRPLITVATAFAILLFAANKLNYLGSVRYHDLVSTIDHVKFPSC